MQIYLPIAEMSVNVFVLLGLGGAVGVLSGIFGVGGGFLLTPFLLFIGIPPAVAVASQANQLIAASISGVIAHWVRGNVDVRMGLVLITGGALGSILGVELFRLLRQAGQVDLAISLSYVIFLGLIGALMLIEAGRAIFRTRRAGSLKRKKHQHYWVHGWPLKMKFPKSKLYISAIAPFCIGAFVGILAAIMGVGGGFLLVPAMIYVIGMPTQIVIGTSLFQIIFVAASVTLLQAVQNQTVDIILALLLLIGGVIGAQLGTRLGAKLRGEEIRGLLGLIVVTVCLKLAYDMVTRPDSLYTLTIIPS